MSTFYNQILMEKLRGIYPAFKIISFPLRDCPKCDGTGEITKSGKPSICLCVCLDGPDGLRRGIVLAFGKAVREVKKQMGAKP